MLQSRFHDKLQRDRGVVLVISLVMALVLSSMIAASVMYSLSETKSLHDRTDRSLAFYLAETGVESAKWEIGEDEDPDGDGSGNTTANISSGSYAVTATDLGNSTFQLVSTGSNGGTSVTLEVNVKRTVNTRFPQGAISVVGNINDLDFEIEKDANLIIDGGNTPAISFSDLNVYNRIAQEFVTAINNGTFPASNITGSPLNTFTFAPYAPIDLPIEHQASYSSNLTDLTALYQQLLTAVNNLKPTATLAGNPLNSTYGDPSNPVTIFINSEHDMLAHTVTGYGTLIVSDRLRLLNGSTLNWTGDVFIVGENGEDTDIVIESNSNLTINGNLVSLAEAGIEAEFMIKDGGQATINGSAFFGADWTVDEGGETEIEIDNNGSLTINGVLTIVGPEAELEFDESDTQTRSLLINGMLQIAVPNTSETAIEFELEGNIEIYKDDQMIRDALDSFLSLDLNYDIPLIRQLLSVDFEVLSWRRVSE